MSTDVSGRLARRHSSKRKAKRSRVRWAVWFIVAAFLLPMILAYVMFATGFGLPTGTINKGELLEPATSLFGLTLTDSNGEPIDLAAEKKWRWLIVGSNSCQQACMDNLHTSRQVHIRLGEKAARLERMYLNTDPQYAADFEDQLQQEHPRLVMAHVDAQAWQNTFQHTNTADFELNGSSLYVVDQEGFAMMVYDSENKGTDLLADIKRLLKYSYDE